MPMSFKLLLSLILISGPLFAQGKSPEPEIPKQEKNLKQDTNEALDDLEKGVKKTGRAAKKGANEALEAVDRGVHKLTEPAKK